MNILLTCAGRRNYLVNYFKEALQGTGKVIATDVQLNAPALVDSDIAIKVPSIYEVDYVDVILGICREHDVRAVISLNDLELPLISDNISKFLEIGVTPIVSDPAVIEICFDKWKTKEFLKSIGLKAPQTYLTLNEALNAINIGDLSYPVVVKPRWGSASIGVEFAESEEELKLCYKLLSLRISKTILGEASKQDIEKSILIQEKLKGQEYGMDILNNLNRNFVTSFAKMKLSMRDGETDKAMTVKSPEFDEVGVKIGTNLRHIGNLDVDVFKSSEDLYVLELNPRFGGGYPFTHEAGVNIPKAIVGWLSGKENLNTLESFSSGKSYAKCDRLVEVPSES